MITGCLSGVKFQEGELRSLAESYTGMRNECQFSSRYIMYVKITQLHGAISYILYTDCMMAICYSTCAAVVRVIVCAHYKL